MLQEVIILQQLCEKSNIIRLHDIIKIFHPKNASVKQTNNESTALVFEYFPHTEPLNLYPFLTPLDIKFYMRETLRAIAVVHSEGIIHRDLKPSNILINTKDYKIRLIDFGLSAFHIPGENYTIAGTLHYQAPEIVFGLHRYDTSADMWSFGCIFGSLIFRKGLFFEAKNSRDLFFRIAQVSIFCSSLFWPCIVCLKTGPFLYLSIHKQLGGLQLTSFTKEHRLNMKLMTDGLPFDLDLSHILNTTQASWKNLRNNLNKDYATDDAIDLLDHLLRLVCYFDRVHYV